MSRGTPYPIDYEWSPYFLRDSRASETRARVKSPHARKVRHSRKIEKWGIFPSHRRVSPFSREVIFTPARISLALLSLRENGDYSKSTRRRSNSIPWCTSIHVILSLRTWHIIISNLQHAWSEHRSQCSMWMVSKHVSVQQLLLLRLSSWLIFTVL